ncbi:DUF1642 domain-containing protein [Lacticaseibacillus rhamnosus]|uniref:DUF1642 domain-containing protein n=1 Tax=Lacticaseibacillus rhamnosus TaxID=47715 RepID=UPI003B9D8D2C
MSEEKMYAIKNDEGKYWDFSDGSGFWILDIPDCHTTTSKEEAELVAHRHGGHVVAFVEEPEKVVLTKKQAKIVEKARVNDIPATYISAHTNNGEESLLINAYVNGYTVEKKYLAYKVLVDKKKHEYFAQAYRSTVHPGTVAWFLHSKAQSDSLAQFTESEIEHYGLQDCEKEEVTDDE